MPSIGIVEVEESSDPKERRRKEFYFKATY
jgi:hypothetical protein